jgi:hypothetical protein
LFFNNEGFLTVSVEGENRKYSHINPKPEDHYGFASEWFEIASSDHDEIKIKGFGLYVGFMEEIIAEGNGYLGPEGKGWKRFLKEKKEEVEDLLGRTLRNTE